MVEGGPHRLRELLSDETTYINIRAQALGVSLRRGVEESYDLAIWKRKGGVLSGVRNISKDPDTNRGDIENDHSAISKARSRMYPENE